MRIKVTQKLRSWRLKPLRWAIAKFFLVTLVKIRLMSVRPAPNCTHWTTRKQELSVCRRIVSSAAERHVIDDFKARRKSLRNQRMEGDSCESSAVEITRMYGPHNWVTFLATRPSERKWSTRSVPFELLIEMNDAIISLSFSFNFSTCLSV